MGAIRYFGAVAVSALVFTGAAAACPVCESETGQKVRAGIFGEDFGTNVALTLSPFPVLAGLVALIYFAFPNPSCRGGMGKIDPAQRGDQGEQ